MKICILDICPDSPTENHTHTLNTGIADYFFVTYKEANKSALSFNKGQSWGYNRNYLYEQVKGKYDYYIFIDYDIELECKKNINPIEYMISALDTYKPLMYRPGGFIDDMKLVQGFAIGGFINHSITVLHESLAKVIFPLSTNYGGFWDSASYLNTITVPIIEKHVLVDYNIIAHNTQSSKYLQNVIPGIGKRAMQKLYNITRKHYTNLIPEIKNIDEFKRHWQNRISVSEPESLAKFPVFEMEKSLNITALKKELNLI